MRHPDEGPRELQSFNGLWPGGYFEGDPLDPMAASTYRRLGYMSVLHATYLACIKPYVTTKTNALEIGPGRGAWSRTMLEAQRLICVDALSAEHNGFWEYVGAYTNVAYHQVDDFQLGCVPDDWCDFVFSFGCFCHLSPQSIEAYLRSLLIKMRRGANAFVMFADYEKFNSALIDARVAVDRALPSVLRAPVSIARRLRALKFMEPDYDMEPRPGRWYHMGTRQMAELAESVGFAVVDPDVGTVHRDPIIHFAKT